MLRSYVACISIVNSGFVVRPSPLNTLKLLLGGSPVSGLGMHIQFAPGRTEANPASTYSKSTD